MVSACLDAHRVTGDARWARARAPRLQLVPRTEPAAAVALRRRRPAAAATGCTPIASNENQGAESTLSFLLALCRDARRPIGADADDRARAGDDAHDRRSAATRRSSTGTRAIPILTAADWPYPAHTVFNAGATRLRDGTTLLLCRVEDRRGHSHLCAARSANGVDGWVIDAEPTLRARSGALSRGAVGNRGSAHHVRRGARQVRDRVHRLQQGRARRRARAHRGLSHASSAAAWSCSPTTRTRRCCRAASTAASRSSTARCTDSGAHIWISYSPDLRNWGGHKLMLQARQGGVVGREQGRPLAAADRDAARLADALSRRPAHRGRLPLPPRRRAASISSSRSTASLRGDSWIFGPEAPYERDGDVGNVTFPCGYTLGADGDTLNLYYGAADTSIALATGSIARAAALARRARERVADAWERTRDTLGLRDRRGRVVGARGMERGPRGRRERSCRLEVVRIAPREIRHCVRCVRIAQSPFRPRRATHIPSTRRSGGKRGVSSGRSMGSIGYLRPVPPATTAAGDLPHAQG